MMTTDELLAVQLRIKKILYERNLPHNPFSNLKFVRVDFNDDGSIHETEWSVSGSRLVIDYEGDLRVMVDDDVLIDDIFADDAVSRFNIDLWVNFMRKISKDLTIEWYDIVSVFSVILDREYFDKKFDGFEEQYIPWYIGIEEIYSSVDEEYRGFSPLFAICLSRYNSSR